MNIDNLDTTKYEMLPLFCEEYGTGDFVYTENLPGFPKDKIHRYYDTLFKCFRIYQGQIKKYEKRLREKEISSDEYFFTKSIYTNAIESTVLFHNLQLYNKVIKSINFTVDFFTGDIDYNKYF
jgi:hypothetical protein